MFRTAFAFAMVLLPLVCGVRRASATEPRELAGFQLGWSSAQAQEACSGAGHEWSRVAVVDDVPDLGDERWSCDGAVTTIGIDVAFVNVYLRAGRVVGVQAAHNAVEVGAGVMTLLDLLRTRYGEPAFAGVDAPWCRAGTTVEVQVHCYLSPTALGTGGQLVVTFPARGLIELRAQQLILEGHRINFVTLTYATAPERRRWTHAVAAYRRAADEAAREAQRAAQPAPPPQPSL